MVKTASSAILHFIHRVRVDRRVRIGGPGHEAVGFRGDKLELNIAARQAARVALLDESGGPYKGFALEDCHPLRGDGVRQAVTWKGDPGLKQLAGKAVRVKIELQDAKLYALQFVHAVR